MFGAIRHPIRFLTVLLALISIIGTSDAQASSASGSGADIQLVQRIGHACPACAIRIQVIDRFTTAQACPPSSDSPAARSRNVVRHRSRGPPLV